MKRRHFITLLGGAGVGWPLAARAQQPAMPVIGLIGVSQANSGWRAFAQGLGDAGFVEGKNVVIEYRWAEGRYERFPQLAADLVDRRVTVIATPGNAVAALAAKAATTTIPIVFGIADDPVRRGLVASLARPGGNITGINFLTGELAAKRLTLLHELVPGATRVVALLNPADGLRAEAIEKDVEGAARSVGLQIRILSASTSREIDAALATLAGERADALFVSPDSFFNSRRVQIVNLAARYLVPASFAVRDYVEVGGLMSYGTDVTHMYRQVGFYTGRVLKGARPADLPVEQSTKFELVLNLQTARMLGLDIPPTLLARADEVIE
jgi:putative tryptophan/tyrosine transport system substrate-binding protein